MKKSLKKLTLDLQVFEIMREEGCLYTDKIRYIYNMLEEGRYYFYHAPPFRKIPDGFNPALFV